MTILFYSETDDPEPWRKAFAEQLPDIAFRVWPDVGDASSVRYALVWKPKAGLLATLPNLQAILALGAGVDPIIEDASWSRSVPLVRLVDAGLAQQMSEYALYGVLHFHLRMDRYAQQQAEGKWHQLPPVLAKDRTVGVAGLGVLGGECAAKLASQGFRVIGWSRRAKSLPGIETFESQAGLRDFLRHTEILVNFLPLTAETRGLLDRNAFAQLPHGACIINIARGPHVNEADLIAALDSGHLGGALLDVFHSEPLPVDHPFWHHPKVIVTPHVAAQTVAALAVSQVIDNIRRIERGESPLGLVDPHRGY